MLTDRPTLYDWQTLIRAEDRRTAGSPIDAVPGRSTVDARFANRRKDPRRVGQERVPQADPPRHLRQGVGIGDA